MSWASAAPAISAAFLASLVEAVEAVTIVFAVAIVRGWRSAGTGALAGLALLALIVLTLGPLSAFGVFWSGEGLGVPWPWGDLAIPGIAALFLLVAMVAIRAIRQRARSIGKVTQT